MVAAAQKAAGVRVDHVIACLSGGRPASYGLAGEIVLESGKVGEHDVASVLAACEAPEFGRGREVLHAQPVNFAVDNRSALADPRDRALVDGPRAGAVVAGRGTGRAGCRAGAGSRAHGRS